MSRSGPPFVPFFIGAIGVLTALDLVIYEGLRFREVDETVVSRQRPAAHKIAIIPTESELAAAIQRWLADQEAAYLEQIEIAESEEAQRVLAVLLDATQAQLALHRARSPLLADAAGKP